MHSSQSVDSATSLRLSARGCSPVELDPAPLAWRAYLSTTRPGGDAGVSAPDRQGPWHNAKGVMIAKNVDDLHSDAVNITKQTALTEKGAAVTEAAMR
jgi:hypothetical protein